MDVSPQPTQFCAVVSAVDGDTTTVASTTDHSIPTHPTVYHKLMKKNNKRKKRAAMNPSSSSSSTSSSACSSQRVLRVRRNPRILVRSNRFEGRDIEAITLPIGMSIAAVITQSGRPSRRGSLAEQQALYDVIVQMSQELGYELGPDTEGGSSSRAPDQRQPRSGRH